jgi:hypothetical protein
MTKRKSKSTKSTVKATAAKGAVKKSSTAPPTTATPPLIVLGYDDQQKPRGARFDHDKPDLVTKAAELIGLKVYDTSNPDVAAIAKKLPVGRLYANGRGFVPNIRQDRDQRSETYVFQWRPKRLVKCSAHSFIPPLRFMNWSSGSDGGRWGVWTGRLQNDLGVFAPEAPWQ